MSLYEITRLLFHKVFNITVEKLPTIPQTDYFE